MDKQTIRKQFNAQAAKFSNWSVTQNLEYMQRYYEFCGIKSDDTLLDVACGTGEYAIFCARKIKAVSGVDLSDKMIEIARQNAEALQLENISFVARDVFELPFESGLFSIVNSKSAFHHFSDYKTILGEMKRCCENDGKISVQDIAAYEDPDVNHYFESLESLIDISHHKTLSHAFISRLFSDKKIEIIRSQVVNIELNFYEYMNHAVQTEERQKEIIDLVHHGVNDGKTAAFFFQKEDLLYFRRNVFLVLGVKKDD